MCWPVYAGSDLVLCIGGAVLLSVPWLEPLEGFVIDGEIFSLSNGHDFDQNLLVDDPVHDTDGFLCSVECRVRSRPAQFPSCSPSRGAISSFRSSLATGSFSDPVELSKIIRRCSSQDNAIRQAVAPSATAPA